MCPLSPEAKSIFIGNEAGLLKKRMPISVRARSSYNNKNKFKDKYKIPNIDLQNNDICKLKLGNDSILMQMSNKVDKNIINISFLHIIPIFEGKNMHFNFIGKSDRSEIHVTQFIRESRCTGDHYDPKNNLPLLGFSIYHSGDKMNLGWIVSRGGGSGGKMLEAVYNIAKDLGIKRIFFFPDKISAARFYYHMDFGCKEFDSDYWNVDVE
jgi:hypothetical protein